MEANCECEPNSAIPKCTCDQVSCDNTFDIEHSKNNCRSSASYWAHASTRNHCSSNPKHTTSSSSSAEPTISTISKCSRAYSVNSKDMAASWRYPVSTCFSPCISVRRLNRPYAEQRMRCFLTTVIAFCLGISVGALLPFFFPPADIFPLSPSTSSSQTNGGVTKSISEALISFPLAPQKESLVAEHPVEATFDRAMPSIIEMQSASLPISKVTFVDNILNEVDEPKETSSNKVLPAVDGIFWSDWVERILPRGFSDQDISSWRSLVANSSVSNVEAGCGRMQNRLVTYDNGKKACCRYRQNFDQIQGEIFSFYLSQLLQIRNLAPSAMDAIDSKNLKWSGVQDQIQASQWVDEKPVVLTQFVDNLAPAFIPELLRSSARRVHPPDVSSVTLIENQMNSSDEHSLDNIRELAQWSDLIVFDYLTANLDRMVNNLYNLQWNPSMMEAPAHNLAKDTSTGLLVFLDNESGLLHGYRLLDKYEHYHRLMLDSLCIFRKSTAEAISRLHAYGSIQPLFKSILSQYAGSQSLPMIPDKSIKVLNQRINTVHRQIQKCQSLYATNSDQIHSDKVNNNNSL